MRRFDSLEEYTYTVTWTKNGKGWYTAAFKTRDEALKFVADMNDDFVIKLRDVINDIADEFASDDGSFSFADCRDALRGVYEVCDGEFISSDWDERKFASELDELRGADRSKFAWLMTYSRLGYEDNKKIIPLYSVFCL